MGIALIIFGVAMIVGIILAIKLRYWPAFGFCCVAGCLFAAISLAICVSVSRNVEYHDVELDSKPIYSLNISSKTSGSFVLGSGSVQTDFVYVFYDKDDENYYVLYYVKASQSRIKGDDTIHPCIKTYVSVPTTYSWWTGFGPSDIEKFKINGKRRYEIYVPSDAIIERYDIYP